MKKIGITYLMKRYPEGRGIEETSESYIELPVTPEIAERVLKNRKSSLLEGALDRICMLQDYYFDQIQIIEEV